MKNWGYVTAALVMVIIFIGMANEMWVEVEKEPPNLYELTRQTAENTNYIFWLLVFGFTGWSFRSYKTGK